MVQLGPREVILIRHAEKTGRPGDSLLSAVGEARAEALADLVPERFGPPDAIVACHTVPKSSRPVDTVRPLADRLGLTIEDQWNTQDYQPAAAALLSQPMYAARRVLVSWRHDTLQKLAVALGATEAPAWPSDVYDRVWILRPGAGRVELTTTQQGLDPVALAKAKGKPS